MKAWYVTKREYLENIRKKSFIIGTILAPLLLSIVYAIPLLSMFFVPNQQISIAVLDHTGRVADDFIATMTDTLKDGRRKYLPMNAAEMGGSPESQREKLVTNIQNDDLDILIEITNEGFASGRIAYISKDFFNERVQDDLRAKLNPILIARRLTAEGLDYAEVVKLTQRARFAEQKITKTGVLQEKQVATEFVLVIVFVMILYISLISWGMSVQRSIIEEKSSRVIEVMLSSVEPRDLFIGKILGIGSLGLTQITIWGLGIFGIAFSSSMAVAQLAGLIHVTVTEVLFFVLFFILGFLFYSSLFTVIGAVCNTEQEAQELQPLTILPLVLPIMLMFLIMQNPNAAISVVLSFVPFFAPMLMLARIIVAEVPAWQIVVSIAILLVSIYGVILFSARVYRVGILMYGKRPSLREIFRWYRYA